MALINEEPWIRVGVIDSYPVVALEFRGDYTVNGILSCSGSYTAREEGEDKISLLDSHGGVLWTGKELSCLPRAAGVFLLKGVTIGVHFHWERREDQVFEGTLILMRRPGKGIIAINKITLETYLSSVISSEMSAEAPVEFLKAHAITSRSWLGAMLHRMRAEAGEAPLPQPSAEEIIRWYTREDHDLYDVCADDHCQRYQGVTKMIADTASEAVRATRGVFLVHGDEICDARFYKACGGRTEEFRNAWEERDVPYLRSISDADRDLPQVRDEADARGWILSRPDAYCNTSDPQLLENILPSFDRETTDFYRWRVDYAREELESVIRSKSGIDFGTLRELIPLTRGPSGRLVRLRIVGSSRSIVVGKELEIRRWLSPSHLYSSAFVVETRRGAEGIPDRFILHGAGWGHGVGLCQIGAAVMSTRGFSADRIVTHYFPGASLAHLY